MTTGFVVLPVNQSGDRTRTNSQSGSKSKIRSPSFFVPPLLLARCFFSSAALLAALCCSTSLTGGVCCCARRGAAFRRRLSYIRSRWSCYYTEAVTTRIASSGAVTSYRTGTYALLRFFGPHTVSDAVASSPKPKKQKVKGPAHPSAVLLPLLLLLLLQELLLPPLPLPLFSPPQLICWS